MDRTCAEGEIEPSHCAMVADLPAVVLHGRELGRVKATEPPAGVESDDNPAGVKSDHNPAGVKSDDNPAGVKSDDNSVDVKSDHKPTDSDNWLTVITRQIESLGVMKPETL